MAFKLKEYVEAINQSRLASEEGKLVIITNKGNRENYQLDTEIKAFSYGAPFLEFKENGKRVRLKCLDFKSANGILVEKYR